MLSLFANMIGHSVEKRSRTRALRREPASLGAAVRVSLFIRTSRSSVSFGGEGGSREVSREGGLAEDEEGETGANCFEGSFQR